MPNQHRKYANYLQRDLGIIALTKLRLKLKLKFNSGKNCQMNIKIHKLLNRDIGRIYLNQVKLREK